MLQRFLCVIPLIFISISLFAGSYESLWRDPDQPIEKRARDLVSKLTLEEKVAQMVQNTPAIQRLGIPAYDWWSECLHGVARNGLATVYPQAIGLGATFDSDLMYRLGVAISDEARAKFNLTSAKGHFGRYQGLTFWSPNVNLFRDPRWGRGQETYGEDPWLLGQLGMAFVKGLQGDHPQYLKVGACAKHYVVHSGPEGLRHEFDAIASPKDLHETYLPAFKTLVVDAQVEIVMGAYNRTNGEPCCGSPSLLRDILLKAWKFDGHIVSDCGAISDFHEHHQITEDPIESAVLALKSGVHLNCGRTYTFLADAVKQGLIKEKAVDRALVQLLKTRFKLGLFDPPELVPYTAIPDTVIHCKSHIALAREAAQKSIVLLKNKDNTLPIAKDLRKVYVTGPLATDIQILLGNYYGLSDNLVTLLEGVMGKESKGTAVQYRQGSLLDRPNVNPKDWFSGVARQSDVTIACVGVSQILEGEEGEAIASPHKGDRFDIRLPQNQIDFLKKIRTAAEKLVVVLAGGSAIACPEVYEMADALLFIWYPGEQGGNAVADIIFGDVSPSGRLPMTFPKSLEQLPPYEDYSMQGRTYRYMIEEPLFPFGFGLSYTTFQYSGMELSAQKVKKGKSITAKVTVTNTGAVKSDEVVQLFLSDMEASVPVPIAALKDVRRITLAPGESQQIEFEITPEMMQMVDMNGKFKLEKGAFQVTIGGSSPGARSVALGAAEPAVGVFEVE